MNGFLDIIVPELPESVVNATVIAWRKKINDHVQRDEIIVEVETDKIIIEIPSPEHGTLKEILKNNGDIVYSKQVLGRLQLYISSCKEEIERAQDEQSISNNHCKVSKREQYHAEMFTPSIRRIVNKYNINCQDIKGSGIDGRIIRKDIEKYIKKQNNDSFLNASANDSETDSLPSKKRVETRIPMSQLRKRMSERLLEAKNNTVMLTTFNEVNMKQVINLRKKYGVLFEKYHSIRLGYMSFYVKATLEALRRYPEVNAFIDNKDIIYRNYFDINIAISTSRGLVAPVLKNVDQLSIAEIERKIKELAINSRNGKITFDELSSGSFTISNGGVFGSLMSTPIINPPQSAILGVHAIKDRPVAMNGKVIILPMMYLSLSYDHRIIDGRESVGFLVTIKEILEDPIRLLLNI